MLKTAQWLSYSLTTMWLTYLGPIFPRFYLLKSKSHLCCPSPRQATVLGTALPWLHNGSSSFGPLPSQVWFLLSSNFSWHGASLLSFLFLPSRVKVHLCLSLPAIGWWQLYLPIKDNWVFPQCLL